MCLKGGCGEVGLCSSVVEIKIRQADSTPTLSGVVFIQTES